MSFFKNLKKGVASLTIAALGLVIAGPVASAVSLGFTDDAEIPSWAEEAIEALMDQGVISGNDDGSFAPNRQLNRAEVSKIIVLASGVDFDVTGGPHFPDVAPGAWYYDYIETMYNQGWINGYPDGLFRPGVGINRAEIAKMVINAFEIDQDLSGAPHFDDVQEGDWFFGYVETAYNNGLMRGYGDGTFGPANAVTRAETVKIVYDAQLIVMRPIGPAEGTLEVILSPDTPRGTNIPFNATSVPYTTLEFTASDDSDVELSAVTLTRLGLGDNDDFDNCWIEIDGFKVGNDKSINNDDITELRFNPPIVIPAGQTIVADAVCSAKYSANDKNVGHHNRLALVSPSDLVTTAANIVGDFPIEGEEMEIADYEVSQIEFTSLGADTTVDVGDNFIEIGKYRLLNISNTNKDIELRAITFKNDGTAEIEDNLENVALYVSGEQVSAETIMDGDYITFRLDNGVTGGYIIEDGDSRIFSIRADIVSAEKDDTIQFKLDNFEDLVGVEIGTSFGVKAVDPDGNDAEDENAELATYTIDAGDLNVSRDPSSLGNQQYAPGSNDVVFLTARVVVDQPLISDGVDICVGPGSVVSDKNGNAVGNEIVDFNEAFDNFRVFLNDKLVDSENDFTIRSGGTDGLIEDYCLEFNTTFEIAGTSILKVVGNVQDDAETGDKVKLKVRATDFDSPEYISTGDQVEAEELLGSAESSFVEVELSQLIITRTDGLSDGDRIVAGVDDVTFMQFVLDNNDSGDVNITSVSIKGIGTGAAIPYTNFTAAIFVDGTQQGSAKNLESNGTATFNDLSVIIPSAAQKEFTVVVDTIEASCRADQGSSTLVSNDATRTLTQSLPICETVQGSVCNEMTGSNGFATPAVAGTTTRRVYVDNVKGLCGNTNITVDVNGNLTGVTGTYVMSADVVATDCDQLAEINTIVISSDGSTSGSNAENRMVVAAIGTNYIDVHRYGSNHRDHQVGERVGIHNFVYPGSTTSPTGCATEFKVANSNGFSSGDVVCVGTSVSAVDGVCLSGNTGYVVGVVGDLLTIDFNNTASGTQCSAVDYTLSPTTYIIEATDGSTLRLAVTDVQADNVENGQEVDVYEGGQVLGSIDAYVDATGTFNDGNCNGTAESTSENYLCGARFTLVCSGRLNASIGATVYSDIIIAESSNVEVLKVRFNAADDEIQIKDLYFINDVNDNGIVDPADKEVGNRVDFKLYNESGQLIQEKQMTNGVLHFELANQDRIRVPKDGSTTVTIKVDAREINQANQTGKQLKLALDMGNVGVPAADKSNAEGTAGDITNGIGAVTAATGDDIDDSDFISAVGVKGQEFVLYRTEISVKHAASQPQFQDPSTAKQEVYRFTVTCDSARQCELGRLTFDVALQGMEKAGGLAAGDFTVAAIKTDGTLDDTTAVSTITNVYTYGDTSTATPTAQEARVPVNFINQRFDAGESRTYALLIANTADTGAASDDDSVSVSIIRDQNYFAPAVKPTVAATGGAAGGPANLVWSDEASTTHNDATPDWENGYLVEIDQASKVNDDAD